MLGIRYPLLMAGMAGGYTTPQLVAAVTRAGGLGTFGATGMTAAALGEAVTTALSLCPGPLGVNVLVAPPTQGNPREEEVDAALAPVRAELGLPPPPRPAGLPPASARELVEAGLAAGARVVSVGLGDPATVADLARTAGVPVVAMAATVEDAVRAVRGGADVIVAQGAEAGGHRSNFTVGPGGEVPLVGTLALVPQVVRAVDVPVVAAGGIMDGRGVVAALALGAEGAQLGTAFLLAAEAASPPLYRERLAGAADTDTVVTAAVTGRPARMLRSALVERLAAGPAPVSWPRQGAMITDVRVAADRAGRADLAVHLAGQASGLAGDAQRGAEEILAGIVRQAGDTIARLASGA
ncbi:MAG: nitronate monooxygenase [Actinomycetota bacterium]